MNEFAASLQHNENPWLIKGEIIAPMDREKICSMYPELATSGFWSGKMEDTFLAVFFSDDRNTLRVMLNGNAYCRAAWSIGLKKIFSEDNVFKALSMFAAPVNGQQKNYLAALSSVAQVNVVESFPVDLPPAPWKGESQQSVSLGLQNTNKICDMVFICKAARRAPKWFAVSKKLFYAVEKAPLVYHSCNDLECMCDWEVDTPAGRLRIPRSNKNNRRTSSQMADAVFISLDFGVRHTVSFRPGPRLPVVVAGSKMGIASGVWHEKFDEFARQQGFPSISYYDPLEQDSASSHGISIRHIRSLAPNKVASNELLIDDAQAEGELPDISPGRYFSRKKRGFRSFLQGEYRQFSHFHPPDFINYYSSCNCLVCRVLSFVTTSFDGGIALFHHLRADVAALGPVCNSDRLLTLKSSESQLRTEIQWGPVKMTKRMAEAADMFSEVRTEGMIAFPTGGAVPTWILDFVSRKSGEVYCEYAAFAGVPFSRIPPYEFVVVKGVSDLSEFGFVPYVISKDPIVLPGYSTMKSSDGWILYARRRQKGSSLVGKLKLKL